MSKVLLFRHLRLVTLIMVLCLSSCSTISSSELKAGNLSMVRGYVTRCRGKLQFVDAGTGEPVTTLVLPAGRQKLTVLHESEPQDPDRVSAENYFCFDVSTHELTFLSNPGKSYRFYAEHVSDGIYQIVPFEIVEEGLPNGQAVSASSKQLSIGRQCGFLIGALDCG